MVAGYLLYWVSGDFSFRLVVDAPGKPALFGG